MFLWGISSATFGQQADSFRYELKPDSLNLKPRLQTKSFIVPAVFVAYGALTLTKGPLKNLNYSVKNEIRKDYPFFKLSIDNYTQYVPAATVFGLNMLGVKGKNSLNTD